MNFAQNFINLVTENELVVCPSDQAMFDHWKNISASNFNIYDEIFAVLPNNTVFAMPDKGLFYTKCTKVMYGRGRFEAQIC